MSRGLLLAVLGGIISTVIGGYVLDRINVISLKLRPANIERLDTFPQVMAKATQVMQRAISSLYIAVDVPGYGASTMQAVYEPYGKAFIDAADHPGLKLVALWFSTVAESLYLADVQHLDPPEVSKVLSASRALRSVVEEDEQERVDTPWLALVNFWVSEGNLGKDYSTIAFIQKIEGRPKVQGFYTEAEEVAIVLREVHGAIQRRSSPDEYQRLLDALQANDLSGLTKP